MKVKRAMLQACQPVASRKSHLTALLLKQTIGLTAVTALIIILSLFVPLLGVAQKISMQVKTFDQSMKPVGNIEISINESGYFMIGSKGTAIVEVNDSGTRITSVKVKDETIEAASWNVSKGVVEIVIRPSRKQTASRQAPAPVVQVPRQQQPLKQAPEVTKTAATKPEAVKPASGLNTKMLDSVSSLTSFYALVRNLPMSNLTLREKNILDAKFKTLLAKERAMLSARAAPAATPREAVAKQHIPISATSRLDDDIHALLQEAVYEKDDLQNRRADFEASAAILSQKLDTGFVGRSDAQRAVMLADIDSLEQLFAGSETAFRQGHNDRREIIHALREKYWNIQHADEGVQPQSGLRLVGIAVIIVAVASLVILLIILYSRLRERTLSLEQAKRKIEQDNESIEDIVKRQTRLLSESNQELNSVLNRSSQELRSVLRSIIGLCKIIEHMPGRELVSRVETATAAMDRVLNKLIDISEIGKDSGNVEQVKLIELINSVREKQVSAAAVNSETNSLPDDKVARSLQFNVNCANDETLFTNRSLLEIVLNNLVENAIHFSLLKEGPGPAIVEVDVVTRGDMMELSVYDNGVGISNAMKSKVFSVSSAGHGLGLYAVRKGVLAMHGKVDIMTEEGVFTRVVLMIPRKVSGSRVPVSREADMLTTSV